MSTLNTLDPLALALGQHGLDFTRFARLMGKDRKTIYSWKAGRHTPDPADLERASGLCRSLDIDPRLLTAKGRLEMGISPTPNRPMPTKARIPRAAKTKENPMQFVSREYLDPDDLEWFGLNPNQDPFNDTSDPEDVFLSPALIRIEAILYQAVNNRQLLAITGDPGAGKSVMLRRFLGRSATRRDIRIVAPSSVDRDHIRASDLLCAILRDLTGKDATGMAGEKKANLLHKTLVDQDRAGVRVAVLIDEAHLLRPEALVSIKQIWDSYMLFRQLAVILVGQRPLDERLHNDPAVRELTGRIRICTLPEYSPDDVAAYLRWRFARVGGDADKIFEPGAFEALSIVGKTPLWIGNKAVMAMHHAAQTKDRKDRKVTRAHIGRV